MAKQKANTSSLLAALTAAKVAFMEEGEAYQTHVILHNKMLHAFNGTIAIGAPIDEEITACPQGHSLRLALGKCGEALSLSATPGKLSVRSGRFSAVVPCLDFGAVRPFQPDPRAVAVDAAASDRIKAAFAALVPLMADNAETLIENALCLEGYAATATNRFVVAQYWHGFNIPTRFLLPRVSVNAVRNHSSPIVNVGHSRNSITFYFADNSWIRSQLLYDERYPDVERFFTTDMQPGPIDPLFNDGIKAVGNFGKVDKPVGFGPNGLRKQDGGLEAKFELETVIEKEVGFLAEHWELVAKHVKAVDWLTDKRAIIVTGDSYRAVILKMQIWREPNAEEHTDENIPF